MKRIDEDKAPEAVPQQLVLYVEDEPANWEVTELRLRKKFKLLWARTDREAIALVRQYGPQLHAVLMDVQLQGSALDGLALTRLFRGKATLPPEVAEGLTPLECPSSSSPPTATCTRRKRWTRPAAMRTCPSRSTS